ncbi:MAG: hypothetical protein R3B09_13915 [Nannocystaceae bacterium]
MHPRPRLLALLFTLGAACSSNNGERAEDATREGASARESSSPRGIDPWLHPQPDLPICPDCPIRGGKFTGGGCTATFAGTLSSEYTDYPVTGLTLKLYDATGLVHTETGISPSTGYANDTVDHTFTPSNCDFETATLSWSTAAGPDSQSVPVEWD